MNCVDQRGDLNSRYQISTRLELVSLLTFLTLQIMPQMLNYLRLDEALDGGVDWGTLAIYTCADNCDQGPAYKKEYLWKQDFAETDVL